MSVGMSGAKKALRARDAHGAPASRRDDPAELGADLGLDPDDLPDGLVVADEHGRVISSTPRPPASPPSPPPTPSAGPWSGRCR